VPKVERLKRELRNDIVGGLALRHVFFFDSAPADVVKRGRPWGVAGKKTSWPAYFFSYHLPLVRNLCDVECDVEELYNKI
jgi:hypothetical protein